MIKSRKSITKRFRKTKPTGGKNPKVRQIKAGGKHLLTKKSPRKKTTLGVKAKIASKSVVKKYKQIISASSK